MTRFMILICLSFSATLSTVSAESSDAALLKLCAGNYGGAAGLQSVSGGALFYDPIQLSVNKKGKSSGLARRRLYENPSANIEEGIVTLSGKVTRVTKTREAIICKLKAKSTDKTNFTMQMVRVNFGGLVTKSITGSARNGDYVGQVALGAR